MPVGQRARGGKPLQVFTQPLFLLGTLITRWCAGPEEPRVGTFAVDHYDVPRAKVEAVIRFFKVPTRNLPGLVLPCLPPVLVETRRPVGYVLVIADSGAGPVPQRRPAPCRVIASEGRVAAAEVGKVSGGKDSSRRISFQDLSSRQGTRWVPAIVNVAGSDENLGRFGIGYRSLR